MPRRFDSDVDYREFYDPEDVPQHDADAGDECPCEDCRRARYVELEDGPDALDALTRAFRALLARRPS